MTFVPPKPERQAVPDLTYFRKHYPLTLANFGALGGREAYLRSIWELDARWQKSLEQNDQAREVIVRGAPPAGREIEGEFEIIYAGGALGLLHAALMACKYGRRVLVFDAEAVGRSAHDWNISANELRVFERAGLLTKDEIASAIVNRYRSGFVKFHDRTSRVKAPPLWMEHVLDVAIDADKLLALAAEKVRAHNADGCALLEYVRFVRAYVEPHRVTVELEDERSRQRRLFAARLFVDATGTASPVAQQLNEGRAFTHVSPTVGTVARGFVRGQDADKVDFKVGEILVSTEDARDHRQLMWEGFAGSPERDEYATYLFFYDAIDSLADKSLLTLFEHYFESLPRYKRAGAQWRVLKPIFGYVPSFQAHGRKSRRRTADERVLLIGDAARLASPLTFNGFGAHLRHLRRIVHLTDLALKGEMLDARSLSELNLHEPRVAEASSLAEFLRPAPKSEPSHVNETLNAVMAALHDLDERVRRELFQDRMSFGALKSLLSRTAKLYPRIFQRVREHLGTRGMFWWFAHVAEAAFSERRERADNHFRHTDNEDAAQEFARYVAIYKKEQSMED